MTTQRDLRGTRALTKPPRRKTPDHHAWLAQRLTPRDHWLIHMLYEHKVLTTHHITDLAFPSPRTANLRLLNLFRWDVVHRFQPFRDTGSHPMHYVLDTAGAVLLAHHHGVTPTDLHYNRTRELGRAHSLQLAHLTGCNTLFTTLAHQSRRDPENGVLTAWWSANRCAHHWGDIITPDAYARWTHNGHTTDWFTEYDTGTEQLKRLAHKLIRYHRLATTTAITTPILFWFTTPQREANARAVLREALHTLDHPDRVPTATSNPTAARHPHDLTQPRWLSLNTSTRANLTDLFAPTPVHGDAGPDESASPRPYLPAPSPQPPKPSVR
ncbi:replication-relaxation family protein [Kibdelosporangium lantanae]|uniref:Replication-relaxation family protein n=1 Tax=Kibdelosporangium lantanae TaxID=1497396 RepID=A0ABW3M5B2_9PSEU